MDAFKFTAAAAACRDFAVAVDACPHGVLADVEKYAANLKPVAQLGQRAAVALADAGLEAVDSE